MNHRLLSLAIADASGRTVFCAHHAVRALRRLSAGLVLAAFGSLPTTIFAASPTADHHATVQLAGLRPGMTKAEATAAMRRSLPGSVIEELYAGSNWGDLPGQYTKDRLRPADPYVFSALLARPAGLASDVDAASCSRGRAEARSIRTMFTTDLRDPRVALIEVYTWYCNVNTHSRDVVVSLESTYGSTPTRELAIRDDGLGLTEEANVTVGGAAFLEWRYDGLIGERAPADEPEVPFLSPNGMRPGVGHRGGGLVVHAELRPAQGGPNILQSTRVDLWDDSVMEGALKRQTQLLQEMQRQGVGIGDLSKPGVIDRLSDGGSYAADVDSAREPDAISTQYVHLDNFQTSIDIPPPLKLYRPAKLDKFRAARTFRVPTTWFLIDPAYCAKFHFDCSKPVPVPNTAWR